MDHELTMQCFKRFQKDRQDWRFILDNSFTTAHPLPAVTREEAWDEFVKNLRSMVRTYITMRINTVDISQIDGHFKHFAFESVVVAGSSVEAAGSQIMPMHFETPGATGVSPLVDISAPSIPNNESP